MWTSIPEPTNVQKCIHYIYLMLKWVKGPITRTGDEWGDKTFTLNCFKISSCRNERSSPSVDISSCVLD